MYYVVDVNPELLLEQNLEILVATARTLIQITGSCDPNHKKMVNLPRSLTFSRQLC